VRKRAGVLAGLVVAVALAVVAAGLSMSKPADAFPVEGSAGGGTPNPPLTRACGLDVLMILDESGSIDQADATDAVRDAFRAFTASLNNTSSSIAVAEFSTVARLPIPTYTVVTNATIANQFNPYINGYRPDGSTNWEDALRVGRFFAPRPDPQRPHLVVFITDGDPNRVIDRSDINQNEYETVLPISSNDTQSVNENQAADAAVPNANAIKGMGSHILAIAVGNALQNQQSLNRLVRVSGPDIFDGTGIFDITNDDIYRVPDFDQLAAALEEAAFQLCAPSVTVRKLVDNTPDPGTDDAVPAAGWGITAQVTTGSPFTWILPAGATGGSATTSTDGAGFATFQWDLAVLGDSTVTITEQAAGAFGLVNDPTATSCVFRTPDVPGDRPLPIVVGDGQFTATVSARAIVTCQFVNRAVPAPAVTLEKATNGIDADDPPGPSIPVGDPVTWTYVVTNTGNVTLSSIAVTDDQGVTVDCPVNALAPGASTMCTATGTATAGGYANVGTVTAVDPFGTGVSDDDPSHFTGTAPGIDIEKATNGEDADLAPGPFLEPGDLVTWTYVVTNNGAASPDDDLINIAVTDDQGVTVTCPQTTLAVGASMTCTATGVVQAGQYTNFGSVSANVEGNPALVVEDSDPSNYFGALPAIDIEKATNGLDADTPTGPLIAVGSPVLWTYVLTNTGNLPITSFLVGDDQLGTIACPRIVLLPGMSLNCVAMTGTAQAGQYANLATVEGTALDGAPVSDSDPSHYLGVQPAMTVLKTTNGEDADLPPGPFVAAGSPVDFGYLVNNTGSDDLNNVTVTDNQGVTVTCPQTTLVAGDAMTCTASGIAVPGNYTNVGSAVGTGAVSGVEVAASNPSNHYGAVAGIGIEKFTNGVNADDPPGPLIEVGAPVEWAYFVGNTGNDILSDIVVTDDRGVTVTCPQTTLAPSEIMQCTGMGTAERGQYTNVATATGIDELGTTVTDDNPSHYLGIVSGIDIEKATNGEDADTPTGPEIPVGGTVTWTYVVRSAGDLWASNIVVTDDQGVVPTFVGGDSNGDGRLDPGETWTYEATGTAEAGQYGNTATVTGIDQLEAPVTNSDPSHYIGVVPTEPAILLTKQADQTQVLTGGEVTYTYVATSTGNAPLGDVAISDDRCSPLLFVGGDTNGDALLDPGESWTWTCTTTLTETTTNTAVVTGTGGGETATATAETTVQVAGDTVSLTTVTPGGSGIGRTGADIDRWVLGGLLLAVGGAVLVLAARKGSAIFEAAMKAMNHRGGPSGPAT